MVKRERPSQQVRPKERHKHPKFTAWLRNHTCCMPGCKTHWLPVFGHHTRHRDDDRYQIPLCTECHWIVHAKGRRDGKQWKRHGMIPGTWREAFGFDFDEKAEELFKKWEDSQEQTGGS